MYAFAISRLIFIFESFTYYTTDANGLYCLKSIS